VYREPKINNTPNSCACVRQILIDFQKNSFTGRFGRTFALTSNDETWHKPAVAVKMIDGVSHITRQVHRTGRLIRLPWRTPSEHRYWCASISDSSVKKISSLSLQFKFCRQSSALATFLQNNQLEVTCVWHLKCYVQPTWREERHHLHTQLMKSNRYAANISLMQWNAYATIKAFEERQAFYPKRLN